MRFPDIQIEDYDYHLPEDRIAFFPLEKRDESKLLIYSNQQIRHQKFKNLAEFLPENTVLILNNTKVIPARIEIQKASGSRIELFLLRPQLVEDIGKSLESANNSIVFEALIGNKKRWKQGESLGREITLHQQKINIQFSWQNRDKNTIEISWKGDFPFTEILNHLGKIPLPPYIQRDVQDSDLERYQTIFSKELGAVAAPTASLHFTEEVMQDLDNRGVERKTLTLHVGAGTFLPVKVDNLKDHPMHREQVIADKSFLEFLKNTNKKMVPVGTTSLRAVESLYWAGVNLCKKVISWEGVFILPKEFAYEQSELEVPRDIAIQAILDFLAENNYDQWVMETELLIGPGYQFHFCDGLITNFHQPKSTLMVLVAGLIGEDWKKVYSAALENNYRFLSYGDSSLVLKN